MTNATKEYHLRQERSNLRGLIPGPLGELSSGEVFRALDEVTFEVRRGEAIGIVGRNGAGKSTLLKMVAGIVEPTQGSVRVTGRVSALIELGAAFEQTLTGRENVYFAAGLLGLGRADIRDRFDSIVEFAGVEEFIDMPVKRYSTGMKARLGFAVATCIQPDILIVDEVLSVGDFAFQRKSLERIREIHAAGATLVLVSHSPWMVEQLCDRLLLLDHGALTMDGRPTEVMARYHGPDHVAELDPDVGAPKFLPFEVADDAQPGVTIDEMWTVPDAIAPNEPIVVVAKITVHRPTVGVLVMSFFTSGRAVFAERDKGPSEFLLHPGTWVVRADIPRIPITTGLYLFRFAVLPEDTDDPDQVFHDAIAVSQAEFAITGRVSARPGLYLDTRWTATEIDEAEREADPVPTDSSHQRSAP